MLIYKLLEIDEKDFRKKLISIEDFKYAQQRANKNISNETIEAFYNVNGQKSVIAN